MSEHLLINITHRAFVKQDSWSKSLPYLPSLQANIQVSLLDLMLQYQAISAICPMLLPGIFKKWHNKIYTVHKNNIISMPGQFFG